MPEVQIYDQQSTHPCDLAWLHQAVIKAVPACLQHLKQPDASLAMLDGIEISIVTDDVIARVHAEFLDDPTPTDVITFHHGEIIVSADTAAREGPAHGLSFDHELCLYMIHGLMHLAGWDDHDVDEAAEMKRRQEAVLVSVVAA
jgi:probable rRNA maturation factor